MDYLAVCTRVCDDTGCPLSKKAVRRRDLYGAESSPLTWSGFQCPACPAQGGASEGKLLATYKKGSNTQGSERRAVCVDGRCRRAEIAKFAAVRQFCSRYAPFPINGNPGVLGYVCKR